MEFKRIITVTETISIFDGKLNRLYADAGVEKITIRDLLSPDFYIECKKFGCYGSHVVKSRVVEVIIDSDSEEKANDAFVKFVLNYGSEEDLTVEKQRIAFSNSNTEKIIEEIRMLKETIYKIAYAQNLNSILKEEEQFQR